jgi:hypothetical protein
MYNVGHNKKIPNNRDLNLQKFSELADNQLTFKILEMHWRPCILLPKDARQDLQNRVHT